MNIPKNMGLADRIIRAVLAGIVLALYFTHQIHGITAALFIGLAIVFLLTSLISSCPLYIPFKISTKRN